MTHAQHVPGLENGLVQDSVDLLRVVVGGHHHSSMSSLYLCGTVHWRTNKSGSTHGKAMRYECEPRGNRKFPWNHEKHCGCFNIALGNGSSLQC